VRDTIALEERQREEEDCTMLDSMLEAQKELQVSLRGPANPSRHAYHHGPCYQGLV
jgi:hypothetical protein